MSISAEAEQFDTPEHDRRPLRADALKNRQRLLDAAEEVFATEGVQAPVDLVAERAGVGIGTLYRHFPTKELLLEAIIRSRLETLVERVVASSSAPDPGIAFFEFFRDFACQAVAKHDLFDALGAAGIEVKQRCAEPFDELRKGIDRLIERAQEAGALRVDVTTDEVLGLVAGTCHAAEQAVDGQGCMDRMIAVICDGLAVRLADSS